MTQRKKLVSGILVANNSEKTPPKFTIVYDCRKWEVIKANKLANRVYYIKTSNVESYFSQGINRTISLRWFLNHASLVYEFIKL